LIKVKIVEVYAKGKVFGLAKFCWFEGDRDISVLEGSVASPASPYDRTSMKMNALTCLELVPLNKGFEILIG
jgi:hypothetical protein